MRKEEGGGKGHSHGGNQQHEKGRGEKMEINTVTISNNDNLKSRNNKAAINYWPGK
jgi:hypothetical protein